MSANADYYAYNRRNREGQEPRIGYTPISAGPIREADPAMNVPAEPRTDGEPFRRFAVLETESRVFICELERTRRFPVNWTDGAVTLEGAQIVAASTRKAVAAPADFAGVTFDQDIADRRAYAYYCGVEASYADGYYGPLTFEAWKASGCPDPYTHAPYAEAAV